MNTIFNIVHRTRTRQHSDDFDRRSEAALTKKALEGALTGAEEAIMIIMCLHVPVVQLIV